MAKAFSKGLVVQGEKFGQLDRIDAGDRPEGLVRGDRRAAVCLELTKKFERVERGWLSELVPSFEGRKVKGEATIAIAGNNPKKLKEKKSS